MSLRFSPLLRLLRPQFLRARLLTACGLLAAAVLILTFSVLTSLAFAAAKPPQDKVRATTVTLSSDAGGTHIGLDLTGTVPFSVFTLANPPRAVVDMPEIDFKLSATGLFGGNGLVSAVRYGLFQPGNSRLVLELGRPGLVRKAQIVRTPGGGWRFTLDLVDTNPNAFAAASGTDKRMGLFRPPAAPRPVVAAVAPPPPPPIPLPRGKGAASNPTSANPAIADIDRPGTNQTGADQSDIPPINTPIAGHKPLIVLDPGHGGVDPGTTAYDGVFEKMLTLAAAREFRKVLLASGKYDVRLTRDRDVFLPLRDRMEMARHLKADLFISLHVNQVDDPTIRGLSVFTLSDEASDDEAGALADAENKADIIAGVDLSHQSSEVTSILIDLAQRETMNLSSRLAEDLIATARQPGPTHVELLRHHPHRFAGFAVLKAADMPSMLVEMGYGSNPAEGKLLESDAYRHTLGVLLLHTVDTFFGHETAMAGR